MTPTVAPSSTTMAPEEALALCRALCDPMRFALMASIWRGERCVCDLQSDVGGQPQNLVSHHLGVLRHAGLAEVRREGRWMYYRPADGLDEPAITALTALLGPRGTATARRD